MRNSHEDNSDYHDELYDEYYFSMMEEDACKQGGKSNLFDEM